MKGSAATPLKCPQPAFRTPSGSVRRRLPDPGALAAIVLEERLDVGDADPYPRAGLALVAFGEEDGAAVARDRGDDPGVLPIEREPEDITACHTGAQAPIHGTRGTKNPPKYRSSLMGPSKVGTPGLTPPARPREPYHRTDHTGEGVAAPASVNGDLHRRRPGVQFPESKGYFASGTRATRKEET